MQFRLTCPRNAHKLDNVCVDIAGVMRPQEYVAYDRSEPYEELITKVVELECGKVNRTVYISDLLSLSAEN